MVLLYEKMKYMLGVFLFLTVTVYVAQIGDKTQVLTLLLATRTKKHVTLFFAIMLGFALSNIVAVLFGEMLRELIPHETLVIISALLFTSIGLFIFRDSITKKERRKHFFGSGFWPIALLILVSDFGDKTQIAAMLFSTTYPPFIVWLAVMTALLLDTALMIFFSKAIIHFMKEHIIKRIAGVVFIVIGLYLFGTVLL